LKKFYKKRDNEKEVIIFINKCKGILLDLSDDKINMIRDKINKLGKKK
jgi:hypothetical protein